VAIVECTREQDVVDALAAGRWPERCDPDLRSHVDGCAVCADLLEVVAPLLDARDVVYADVRVPSSGTVWWRAQVRARREAARQATRPITVAQTIAASIGVAGLVASIVVAAPWLGYSFAPLAGLQSFDAGSLALPDVSSLRRWAWVIAIVLGTWLIVAPIAIYLTGNED
jgi:hypothetical protein